MIKKQIELLNEAIEIIKKLKYYNTYAEGFLTSVVQHLEQNIIAEKVGELEQCEIM